MATKFDCKHEVCVAPACICPREEVDTAQKFEAKNGSEVKFNGIGADFIGLEENKNIEPSIVDKIAHNVSQRIDSAFGLGSHLCDSSSYACTSSADKSVKSDSDFPDDIKSMWSE